MPYHELRNVPYTVAVELPTLPKRFFWRVIRPDDRPEHVFVEIRRKFNLFGSRQIYEDFIDVETEATLTEDVLACVENLYEIFHMVSPQDFGTPKRA